MESTYYQRCPEVFRTSNYCPSGVMTTLSGGFISDMPSASSSSASTSSPPGTPETAIVVINGLTGSIGTSKGGGPSQRNHGPSVATASSSSTTVTPLLTIGTSRVVVSSASGGHSPSSITSAVVAKGTIISSSDSPQIIVAAADGCGSRSYASLTPVNPVIVSEGDGSLDSTSNGTAGVGVQPTAVNIGGTFVQYVEATSEPMYSNSNGQIAYPVYTVGDTTMYAASPTYYTTGNTPVTYSQEVTNSPVGGPILAPGSSTFILQQEVETEPHPIINPSRHSPQTDGNVTYMVSGSNSNGGGSGGTPLLDADAQANIAHATRVSPVTVQWLLDNYETAEGVSLPRSTLYNHYLFHCADHKLDPVNSASFGKLIRSVFMGLRTRRLGTRGNSKYHYYGIRVKPSSELNSLNEDGEPFTNLRHQGSQSKKRDLAQSQQEPSQSQGHHGKGVSASGNAKSSDTFDSHHMTSENSPQTVQNQQYLGDVNMAIPHIPEIPLNVHLPEGITRNNVTMFFSLYQEHIENILEVIYNLQFNLMETVWRRFWALHSNNNNNNNNNADKTSSSEGSDEDEGELASKFPTNVLHTLLRSQVVLDLLKTVDHQFYQNIVEVLIPDVLRSIPPALTQSIRNFAKSLEGWLSSAMSGYPQEVVQVKVNAVSSLAQTLRRYTSLNHLAQAARAVLQNSSQISQMLSDLNRVDFRNVQEQASWVCECDPALVERLEEDFKKTLQQQNSLEQWAEWLHAVVEQTLMSHAGSHDFAKQARQFLLKWSFYSSMVIRDLTLRSAASFGSFHLIRLLYDEYMFYLVEHKVANAMGLTPIAVMSQFLSVSKVQTTSHPNLSDNGEELFSSVAVKRPKFEDS